MNGPLSMIKPSAAFRRFAPVLLCCLALALAACKTTGSADSAKVPVNPNELTLAYGLSLTMPTGWDVVTQLNPEVATNASLDSRRQNNERILLVEALGPAGQRGLQSLLVIFVVNEQGTFMPRTYAEKLSPEEFAALSKDLLERERASAKKQKTKSSLLEVQVTRESVNDKLALNQRMLVTGQDGRPVRLINWDIYLPNGAGIAVKTVCDPENPAAEEQLNSIVRSLRIQ